MISKKKLNNLPLNLWGDKSGREGMRTKCVNCGTIYDIPASDMDIRTPSEIAPSGKCPRCGSNAHNPIPLKDFWDLI